MGDVISHTRFLEEREKKLDPKGYKSRKVFEAISEQVKAKEAAKPLLIGNTEVIDPDFDDDPVMDKALCWGTAEDHYEKQRLLNRYFAEQSDPGDET